MEPVLTSLRLSLLQRRTRNKVIWAASLLLAACFASSCAPDGPTDTEGNEERIVDVNVFPDSAKVLLNDTLRFEAVVTGSHPDHSVVWSALHGKITESGLYTAPDIETLDTVVATSTVNPDISGHSVVHVILGEITDVDVLPDSAMTFVGDTLRFEAVVTGSHPDHSVVWSALDGTITESGLYTAPSIAADDTITATSMGDSGISDRSVVHAILGELAFWGVPDTLSWNNGIFRGKAGARGIIGEERLTSPTYQDLHPAWSPMGNQIAFSSNRHPHGLYVMNPDGSDQAPVSDQACAGGAVSHPDWSPDGTRIAFGCTGSDGKTGIGVINADGSGPHMLIEDPGCGRCAGAPTWSPDGDKIAFHAYWEGNWEIYVVNVDGTGMLNLTNSPTWDQTPAWSPDGARIAFARAPENWPSGGNFQIWVLDVLTFEIAQVTSDSVGAVDPRWSFEGNWIVYGGGCCSGSTMDIWVSTPDGSLSHNVTQSPGAPERYPSWRPPH